MSNPLPINFKLSPHRELQAYENQINIHLFNQITEFLSTICGCEKANPVYGGINIPWFKKLKEDTLQNQYGWRYLGEILERYKEKVGSDQKNLRAIALALACSKPLLEDNMFVGDQKECFLHEVKSSAIEDIYLTGALYLLFKGTPQEDVYYNRLQSINFQNTEDIVFTISLFDNLDQKLEVFLPQLIKLLGCNRSLSLLGNMGIYLWVINRVCPIIKNTRKKGMALFRALNELADSAVREGSRYYQVLSENGFQHAEITYANFVAMASQTTHSKHALGDIVTEKVAVEFIRVYLNAEETHSETTYELMDWVLRQYSKFSIRISGWKGILSAIKTFTDIKNPQTFAWVYQYKCYDCDFQFLKFDIMDRKWDVLYQKLGEKIYLRYYDMQLLREVHNSDEVSQSFVQQRLERFKDVTGVDYSNTFISVAYRYDIFEMLVKFNIIDIKEFTKNLIDKSDLKLLPEMVNNDELPAKKYLHHYISRLPDKKAFELLSYLFKNYNPSEIRRLLTTWRSDKLLNLYEEDNGRVSKLSFRRPFLSDAEHLQLFSWLDKYIFFEESNKYISFITTALKDSFVHQICPKDQLRGALYVLLANGAISDTYDKRIIKELIYSEEELLLDAQEEQARLEAANRLARKKTEENVRAMFDEKYDGTFASIWGFYDGIHQRDEMQLASSIVLDTLKSLFADESVLLCNSEMIYMLKTFTRLVKNKVLPFTQLQNYTLRVKEDNHAADD